MFWLGLLLDARAADAWCTDYGPATVEDRAGDLSGAAGTATLRGTPDAVRIEAEGVVVFDGPWSDLAPTRRDGACAPARVRLGGWPEPWPLGARRALRTSASDLTLFGPDGATRLSSAPMDRALARALAAELDRAFPLRRTEVLWTAGVGLVVISSDPTLPLPAGEPPRGDAPGMLVLLGLGDPEDTPAPPEVPEDLVPGAALFAALAAVRDDAALPLPDWDPALAEAALRHARYLDQAGIRPGTHRQDPAHPAFTGETPEDRGGAEEWLLTGIRGGPDEALAAWLASPYPRERLLHPHLEALGVASAGGAWVAELRVADGPVLPSAWPRDGATAPGRSLVAREDPDPLPLLRYPDRRWPVGFPVTVRGPKPLQTGLWTDDAPAEHWLVGPPLGAPKDTWHLVPKDPLPAGAAIRWSVTTGAGTRSGTLRAPEEPLDAEVGLPEPVLSVLRRANVRRAELGAPPLRATLRAEATARWVGARARAATEGLDPARLRVVVAPPPGATDAPTVLCVRPGEVFPLDEALLDPRTVALGADLAGVTVTWSVDPATGARRSHVAGPRTCAILLRDPRDGP